VSSCKFVVLSGNHRLRAIKQTKRITGEYVIRDVLCHVYTELSRDEALHLGVNNNSHNDHANAMSDWQKVNLLRSLLHQPHSQVSPVDVSTYELQRFYTILGAKTVCLCFEMLFVNGWHSILLVYKIEYLGYFRDWQNIHEMYCYVKINIGYCYDFIYIYLFLSMNRIRRIVASPK